MIQPIVDLVKATKFAILQNEGIIALSLLCINQQDEGNISNNSYNLIFINF
jgi:hypothetical protein